MPKKFKKIIKKINLLKIKENILQKNVFPLLRLIRLLAVVVVEIEKLETKIIHLNKTCSRSYIRTMTRNTIISQNISSKKNY